MVTRAQLIREARKWLGTPFQHQGRVRGLGVDCVGLILCVMRDLGLGDYLAAHKAYAAQPVGRLVLEACRAHLAEKPASGRLPGDVLVFRVPVDPVHAALVTERGIIHAAGTLDGRGQVSEVGLDRKWARRIEACFSIPGVI